MAYGLWLMASGVIPKVARFPPAAPHNPPPRYNPRRPHEPGSSRTHKEKRMQVLSLNIGRPQIVLRGGRQYSTAIDRRPTDARVFAEPTGFVNDRVSNDRVHGGPEKAICVFPHEHYAHFSARLGRDLAVPAFGENLTTLGLLETDVAIGDSFRVGSAVVQVSQPRQPCGTLAEKHGRRELIAWINESQFCGWYFRVVQPGEVATGDTLQRLDRPHPDATIAWAMQTLLHPAKPLAALERLLSLPELSAAWRKQATARLTGQTDDD